MRRCDGVVWALSHHCGWRVAPVARTEHAAAVQQVSRSVPRHGLHIVSRSAPSSARSAPPALAHLFHGYGGQNGRRAGSLAQRVVATSTSVECARSNDVTASNGVARRNVWRRTFKNVLSHQTFRRRGRHQHSCRWALVRCRHPANR